MEYFCHQHKEHLGGSLRNRSLILSRCRSVKEITRNHLSFLDGNDLLAKL